MENRKKTVEPNFICITGIVILFLILECVENFLPSWEVPIIIIKGFTSLIPFGLALFSTLKYPDYFKSLNKDWSTEVFPNLKINVEVDVKLH